MRLLLDTRIFMWACSQPQPQRLSVGQRKAISCPLSRAMGFEPVPITLAHGLSAGSQIEGLAIMTADRKFALYQAPLFAMAAG